MFSRISSAVETANFRLKSRIYDQQIYVPGVAELYFSLSLARWPIDFLKDYAGKNDEPQQEYHA